LAAAALSVAAARAAFAQGAAGFPNKPIRLLVPFAPGGSGDILGRILATGMSEEFGGRPVIVENRGGASGRIANEALVAAPRDGYAAMLATVTNAVLLPGLTSDARLDPRRIYAPVSLVATQPMVLTVSNIVPANSLQELVALMRARPNSLNYGSSGTGGIAHLGSALVNMRTNTQSEHVPYRGTGPAYADLIAGNIHWLIDGVASQSPYIRAGQLRPLAVLAPQRSSILPNVPTAREQGLDLDIINFVALFGSVGTPADILGRLENAVRQSVAGATTAGRLREAGTDPVGSTSGELRAFWEAQLSQWLPVVSALGLQLD